MKAQEKMISIREFARRVETDEKNVRVAIKLGYIVSGYDKKAKKIIFEKAYEEWGVFFKQRKVEKEIKAITTEDLEKFSGATVFDVELGLHDNVLTLERKHLLIKANRDLLKLKTEAGELQNKEETYRELFAFGKEVRTAFQAIPDRIIDQLITLDRNAAHRLLSESINEVLLKLAESGNAN